MKSKRGGGNMNNNNNMNLGSNNNNNLNNSDGGDYNMIIIIVIALIILGVLVYFGYKYLNSYQASQSVTKTFIPFIHDVNSLREEIASKIGFFYFILISMCEA